MWKRTGAALLLAASCGAAWAQATQEGARGALVVIGGALRGDNAEVWERIVRLAGGKGAAIAVFPAAAGNPERSARSTVAHLQRYGARAFVVPIGAGLGAPPALAADDRALAARVRKAGGAFFTGGDQARITAALVRPDGTRSRVLDALWSLYRDGGVIAGTSAGAAMMSTTMFYQAPPVLPMLKAGVREGRDFAPGLGFAGPEIFIDQHLLVRGRFARMLPVMLAKGYRLGLGVDENSAVVLGPGRTAQVIGYKGALLLDLSAATVDAARPGFNVSNARISYLDSGDRIDFGSNRLQPGADKERLDPARPQVHGALFYTDILANTMVVDLLEKLADSDQASAIGLALGGPASTGAEHGFEFVFRRVPETEAYVSNRAEAYSVYRVRLDVRPVLVRQPLYEAR